LSLIMGISSICPRIMSTGLLVWVPHLAWFFLLLTGPSMFTGSMRRVRRSLWKPQSKTRSRPQNRIPKSDTLRCSEITPPRRALWTTAVLLVLSLEGPPLSCLLQTLSPPTPLFACSIPSTLSTRPQSTCQYSPAARSAPGERPGRPGWRPSGNLPCASPRLLHVPAARRFLP